MNVRWHVNGGSPVTIVLDFHPKEFMLSPTSDCHFAEMGFEEVENISDNGGVNVGNFGIINEPPDSALGARNGGVGDAEIIGVENKAMALESACEKLIPKDPAHDAPVDSLIAAHI